MSTVATYLIDALRQGGTAIVIATPTHRAALDAELTSEGFSVEDLQLADRYCTFDARETLDAFMSGDRPDRTAFDIAIGAIIDRAAADGTPVRCFGEMVALLWDDGNIDGALELESMWNDLAEHHAFALFCAYAMSSLEASGDLAAAKRMSDRHSDVLSLPDRSPSETGSSADREAVERIFVGAPAALREVRRFVREVLHSWCDEEQLVDAEIIASELATNAVKYAHSPFRVSLARTASSMTLSVRDASFDQPRPQVQHTNDGGGRGLALVSELSSSWGTHAEPDGKTVWAEVARVPAR